MKVRHSLKSWLTGRVWFISMLLWRHRYKKRIEGDFLFSLLNIFCHTVLTVRLEENYKKGFSNCFEAGK